MHVMTVNGLPDFDELAVELVRLRHRHTELARRLEKAEERAAQFPSDFSRGERDELRAGDRELKARIAELEVQLRPVLRRVEPQ
jgi:hypothetical protein